MIYVLPAQYILCKDIPAIFQDKQSTQIEHDLQTSKHLHEMVTGHLFQKRRHCTVNIINKPYQKQLTNKTIFRGELCNGH